MRLIDADEMLNHIGAVYTAASRHREYGYKEIMQEMRQRARHSQVEAIPIEWIEELAAKLKEDNFEKAMFLLDVIDVWREENESKDM